MKKYDLGLVGKVAKGFAVVTLLGAAAFTLSSCNYMPYLKIGDHEIGQSPKKEYQIHRSVQKRQGYAEKMHRDDDWIQLGVKFGPNKEEKE